MPITKLSITGLRGFATTQDLDLALPNGRPGSGLTMLVGPNNAGKSTVVEAFQVFASNQGPSFTEGKRNRTAGDRVDLAVESSDGTSAALRTVVGGGSETEWVPAQPRLRILALPSRRHFNPYFGRSIYGRDQYAASVSSNAQRGAMLDHFAYRLFEIQRNRAGFDAVLGKVLSPVPHWVIDQSDNGNYYLKFTSGGLAHSSEGIGEGLVSLLVLIDALYDSRDGDVIVIDEPELSLHPAFQRRMSALFLEYSATRQLVISTHSPYFLELAALEAGGRVSRVHFTVEGSRISQLSETTGKRLVRLLKDTRNPHVLGLDAREAFFLDDGVILVEGQDDVIHYVSVAEKIGVELNGTFFGWGVGGADKMPIFASLLAELGFDRVAGLVDGDRAELAAELQRCFPGYRFAAIPAKDVRTKSARAATPRVLGLLDERGEVRPEYAVEVRDILAGLNEHLVAEKAG